MAGISGGLGVRTIEEKAIGSIPRDYDQEQFKEELLGGRTDFRRLIFRGLNLEDPEIKKYLDSQNQYINLREATLSHLQARGVNLRKCVLEYTKLDGANLDGADLERSKLFGVELVEASLREANLSHTEIVGKSNLAHANLEGATLNSARISGGSDIREANFKMIKGVGLKLRGTYIFGVNFELADLRSAEFEGVMGFEYARGLDSAILKGAKGKTMYDKIHLAGIHLSSAYNIMRGK